MPVSRLRKFAFIHVRKTGGTSIVRALEALDPQLYLNEKGMWDVLCAYPERRALLQTLRGFSLIGSMDSFPQWHLPAVIVRRLIGAEQWDSSFTFAFIRNPWDLMVSAYHFEKHYLSQPHVAREEVDRSAAMGRCYDFDRFVRLYPLLEPVDMTSMIVDEKGQKIVDYIGRFENLNADFAEICSRLGVKPSSLGHENRSEGRGDYRAYYSDETRRLVGRYFARDIQNFGYEF